MLMFLKVIGELCIAEVKENLPKLRPQSVKHLVQAVSSCYQLGGSTVTQTEPANCSPVSDVPEIAWK